MKSIDRLNQRFGESIYQSVLSDLNADRSLRPGKAGWVGKAAALLILASPYVVIALGLLLIALNLSPLSRLRLRQLHYDGSQDLALFQELAQALQPPLTPEGEALLAEAAASLHTVDQSHPPTRFRMEAVEASGCDTPQIIAAEIDWTAIDAELAGLFEAEEEKLLSQIIVQ